MKKEKKGFTLLELVIVIAVFAILIAILIPTFVGILRRAKLSVDQSTVKNMNTFALESEHSIGRAKTIREAIAVLYENGYDIERLTPTANGALILWDSINDRWILFDTTNGNYIQYDKNTTISDDVYLWNVSDVYEAKYSVYLKKGYTGQSDITISTGLDVGENTNVNSVNYERLTGETQTVIIYTNGGSVTINAPADVVYHYGEASSLNIIEVANASYHECGKVNNAQIQKGRIVIENNEAKIDNLLLIAKSDKSGFQEIIFETKSSTVLPAFDRTDVNISPNGTLVLNVVTPTSDEYIYLTRAGVIEQIVVTTEEVNTTTDNVTDNLTAKSAEQTSEKTFSIAEQVANVGNKNNEGKYVDGDGNPVELNNLTNVSQIVVETKGDSTDIEKGTTYFAGGVGTEKSPYIIANLDHWNNIATDSAGSKLFALAGNYYKVVSDLTFDANFKYINNFSGHLDFGNHTVTCTTEMADEIFILYSEENTSIKNLNVENSKENFSMLYANCGDILFENINMRGSHTVSGHNQGMFIMYAGLYSSQSEINITLNNCNVYSSITGVGTNFVGAYLGSFNYLTDNQVAKLIMKNCTNYGNIIGEKVAMVVSSAASCAKNFVTSWDYAPVVKMYFENVRNEGLLHGNSYSGLVMSMAGIAGYYEYVEGGKTRGTIEFYSDENFENRIEENSERVKLDKDTTPEVLDIKNVKNGSTMVGPFAKLIVNSDKTIDFTNVKSNNAAKYIVSFGWTGVYGASNGAAYSYNIEIPANEIDSAVIYSYEWVNKDTYGDSKAVQATDLEISEVDYFGITFKIDAQNRYVFDKPNSQIRTQPTLRVYAFDSNNKVINIGTEDGTKFLPPTTEPIATAYNFIQVGYTQNARCGSDGGDRSGATGYTRTEPISVQQGDIVYVRGLNLPTTGTYFSCIIRSNNTKAAFLYSDSFSSVISNLGTIGDWKYFTISASSVSYIKLTLQGLVNSDSDVEICIWRNGEWLTSN